MVQGRFLNQGLLEALGNTGALLQSGLQERLDQVTYLSQTFGPHAPGLKERSLVRGSYVGCLKGPEGLL